MVNVEIQRNGIVSAIDLKKLFCGMRRIPEYYGYNQSMIPKYLSDSELRSLNSIVVRNSTNKSFLSQKSYCTFTILSATKESYAYAERKVEKENLMERKDYILSRISKSRALCLECMASTLLSQQWVRDMMIVVPPGLSLRCRRLAFI